uniref:ATP-dependent Clp protease proteolytic subunit n=1 Tax=uncultured Choricystis TaxID=858337 RepID=A0A346HG26_9CHLO|nr:proteolytic subunit 2 of clp protease [uncultured Choricystis]
MPIGVPKVEYRLPGEPEADWLDLYNCLYRERMLFLCQDLGDEVANQLISLMLYLNTEDSSLPFFMYINSLGGSVTCGIGVFDIMRYLHSGITTICMGTASSMASFVLTGGTYGRRLSLPHGRIMIHQPEGGSDGQASEILSESTEVSRIRRQIGLLYAIRTQQTVEQIAQDMDRDQFMSAEEAKNYGLIDFVARPAAEAVLDDSAALETFIKASDPAGTLNKLATADGIAKTQDVIRELPQTTSSTSLLMRNSTATTAFLSEPQDTAPKYTGLLGFSGTRAGESAGEQNPFDVVVSTTPSSVATIETAADTPLSRSLENTERTDESMTMTELQGMVGEVSEDPFALFIPWTEVLGKNDLDLPETYTIGEADFGAVAAGEEDSKDVSFESFDLMHQRGAAPEDETIPLFIHSLSGDEI